MRALLLVCVLGVWLVSCGGEPDQPSSVRDCAVGAECSCEEDLDCGDGQLCDSAQGRCFEAQCEGDGECGLSEVCERGECVPDLGSDEDRDGVPDAEDNCRSLRNADQEDLDRDGEGDACDNDIDGDNIVNHLDNCPNIPNPLQGDEDRNGVGDICEPDFDNDGVLDDDDNCPGQANPSQADLDVDGLGDACDADLDGDGMVNGLDNCPLSHNPMQDDRQGLGRGVKCSGGTIETPILIGCGVHQLHLDTRERADEFRGSCGGAGAPEVVFQMSVVGGKPWSVQVLSDHAAVVYLLTLEGQPVGSCGLGGLETNLDLPEGEYLLVVDGFVSEQGLGPLEVAVSSQLCGTTYDSEQVRRFPIDNRLGSGAALNLGDFNEDGHPDIVTGNRDSRSVSVLLGDGHGSFGVKQDFTVGLSPYSVSLGDVNEDGHLDIVTANAGDYITVNEQRPDSVSVLLGNGRGGFAAQRSFPVSHAPFMADLGDVNEDGHPDIITANRNSSSSTVLLGDGQGDFRFFQTLSVSNGPLAVDLGDVNNDGHLDIATVSYDPPTATVMLGDGQGRFTDPEFFTLAPGVPRVVVLRDVNSDGHLDLTAVQEKQEGNVNVLLGDGQGAFGAPQVLLVGEDPESLEVVDINRDGRMDIVTANRDSNNVGMLLGDGRGGFAAAAPVPVTGTPFAVKVGDLNSDGLVDIVTANRDTGDVSVVLGKGQGGYFPQKRSFMMSSGPSESGVRVLDLNGDSHLDVFVPILQGVAAWGLGDGRGGFSVLNMPSGGDRLADFNEDGVLDLVDVRLIDVVVRLGLEDGVFEDLDETRRFPIGGQLGQEARPTSFEIVDVNNDGHLDIVTANSGIKMRQPPQVSRGRDVSVLLGDGQGSFADTRHFAVDDGPVSMAVGDLDGDGNLDIVTANAYPSGSPNNVSVLMGDGEGDFSAHQTFPVGSLPQSVALGDFDSDGALDIVTANAGTDDLSVLLGDGQGGFAPQETYPAGGDVAHFLQHPEGLFFIPVASTTAYLLSVGDINNDSHLDIVITNPLSDNIGLLYGDGRGDFAPLQTFPVEGRPNSVGLGDFDEDGHLDIVTAGRETSTLMFLRASAVGQRAVGSRLTNSPLRPCPSLSAQASSPWPDGSVTFTFVPPEPCRVDRVALDLSFNQSVSGPVTLSTAQSHSQTLVSLPARIDPGLWRPEQLNALASFERHPVAGTWRLEAGAAISGQMLVNSYPDDPFGPETRAEACRVDIDQPATFDAVCRLEGDLSGLTLENGADEDIFLLEGAAEGALVEGDTLTATLVAEPGRVVTMGLHAFRAIEPLATAETFESGVWTLSFVIPPEYSGRYFAIHVGGEARTSYDLQVEIVP